MTRSLALLAILACLVVGCGDAPNTKRVELNGITFVMPDRYKEEVAETDGDVVLFQFEGIPGQVRGGQLSVLGKGYGGIESGDVIAFQGDGSFTVNGEDRESVGLGTNTVESAGVLFTFTSTLEERTTDPVKGITLKDSSGRTYRIEGNEIVVDGHSYGPYAKGNVVKISADGSVSIYL